MCLLTCLPCADRLDLPSTEAAAHVCTCVFDCNVPLLRRFIKAGIAVNAGNFDKRTALHVAAAEGNLAAVRTCHLLCSDRLSLLCNLLPECTHHIMPPIDAMHEISLRGQSMNWLPICSGSPARIW